MAQHDYVIDNATGATTRADINSALAAAVSLNSGATEPATTYAYMSWADTATGLLKIRNAVDNAWGTIGPLSNLVALAQLLTTQGDIAYASAANTPARLAKGTARQQLNMNAGATAPEWMSSLQSLLEAHSIIASVSANTPANVTVAEQRFLGRKTGGNIGGLTGAEAQTILAKYTSGLINLSFAATAGSKALTVALKGEDGNDPSATNPVTIVFRDETLTTGTPNIRTVTAATSVVLSSGSTLGFTAAAAGRLYVWAIDNAGTVELALSRTADIFPESNLVSTTAEGGAGAADSAIVMYSTTARTNVACRCIGYIEITTGATAGEWDNNPTKIQVMGPGVKRTGDVVQVVNYQTGANATGTTRIPQDTTIPQITEGDEYMTKAITPTSAVNRLIIDVVFCSSCVSPQAIIVALFMDAVANALSAAAGNCPAIGYPEVTPLRHSMVAGTVSAITFRVHAGTNATETITFNAGGLFGGVSASSITITEVMA